MDKRELKIFLEEDFKDLAKWIAKKKLKNPSKEIVDRCHDILDELGFFEIILEAVDNGHEYVPPRRKSWYGVK